MQPALGVTTVSIARPSGRALYAIGTLGAALSFAILAASVLLRLATVFDAQGQPLSTLPAPMQDFTRLIHRVAASGVGLLAATAVFLCWTRRRVVPEARWPTALIAVATTVLAAIGPLTSGYRYASVTVANVVGGIVLLMACWWLRETLSAGRAPRPYRDALLYTTFVVFLIHVASGAANSALDAHGIRWAAFAHAGTAMLATIFVGGTLWERRAHAGARGLAGAMAALLALQVALGMAALWISPRPLGLAFLHALLSVPMAAGLVSIAVRTHANSGPKSGIS